MKIANIIDPQSIYLDVKAGSKRQLLQELAQKASELSGIDERTIFDALLERENLGTTGFGGGTALPHARLENLDKIERSVKFLRSFMDDILDLSLLESGRVAYEKREIPFVPFLEELTGSVKSMAEKKQLLFLTEQRGVSEQSYCFDGDRLKAALLNIMENAVKYTPAGGRVDFIAELLQDTPGSGKFRFEVRDTGIGMS